MLASMAVSVMVPALAGSGLAADLPAGRPVPIKELHERTSSLVARDVVVVGMVEAVVAINPLVRAIAKDFGVLPVE